MCYRSYTIFLHSFELAVEIFHPRKVCKLPFRRWALPGERSTWHLVQHAARHIISGFTLKWQKQIPGLFSTINPRKSRPIPALFTVCWVIYDSETLWILNCLCPTQMLKQVAQLSQRDALQCGSVVAQISMLFYVFKEHCCRLLLQLVSPVNRQQLKCHRKQLCHANGWFTSRTKFVFKGMSPTNYLCTDR